MRGNWDRNDSATLKDHITKDIVVTEIERQLHAFLMYATRMGKTNAVRSYTQAYHTIRRIHTTRNGFNDPANTTRTQLIETDKVYESIIENLKRFQ